MEIAKLFMLILGFFVISAIITIIIVDIIKFYIKKSKRKEAKPTISDEYKTYLSEYIYWEKGDDIIINYDYVLTGSDKDLINSSLDFKLVACDSNNIILEWNYDNSNHLFTFDLNNSNIKEYIIRLRDKIRIKYDINRRIRIIEKYSISNLSLINRINQKKIQEIEENFNTLKEINLQ